MGSKSSPISWNWSACLANMFWFAYRKMWLWVGILAAAILLLMLLGTASAAMSRLTLLLSIGITFVTGTFGNHLYRKHVAKLVGGTSALDQPAAVEALRSRGGVSVAAVWIAVGAFALVTLVMIVAAAMSMQNRGADDENGIVGGFGPYEAGGGGDPSQGISGQSGGDAVSGEIGGEIGGGGGSTENEGDKPVDGYNP